jgi:hypothetical protein
MTAFRRLDSMGQKLIKETIGKMRRKVSLRIVGVMGRMGVLSAILQLLYPS